jgi:hypothetical protein
LFEDDDDEVKGVVKEKEKAEVEVKEESEIEEQQFELPASEPPQSVQSAENLPPEQQVQESDLRVPDAQPVPTRPTYVPFEPPNQYSDSDDSDSEEDQDNAPAHDKMFAEFLKVKRQKDKFSCEFRNAVLHVNGKDFVIKFLSGDILY